mmetsp:Transcript_40015/g.125220  ORF Transcript_40015/g.125220 Transcript_40015/m.125220 type:complete len:258 (+) Transcript_40015:782-1555(+)
MAPRLHKDYLKLAEDYRQQQQWRDHEIRKSGERLRCAQCQEEEAGVICFPCEHLALCTTCSKGLPNKCPACGDNISVLMTHRDGNEVGAYQDWTMGQTVSKLPKGFKRRFSSSRRRVAERSMSAGDLSLPDGDKSRRKTQKRRAGGKLAPSHRRDSGQEILEVRRGRILIPKMGLCPCLNLETSPNPLECPASCRRHRRLSEGAATKRHAHDKLDRRNATNTGQHCAINRGCRYSCCSVPITRCLVIVERKSYLARA